MNLIVVNYSVPFVDHTQFETKGTVAGDSDSFLNIELPYLVSRGQYWLILDGTAAYIPLYIEKVEKWSGVTDP